ncbi:MAG TPA: TonB family protein [Thermoanaerobaculia bacterium]|nr:TonB family protein [Thermoanaerobaculia bacterium]
MAAREQFGDYVLLKKLFEDSLGETFRAGKAGKQGLEQVVLLRVLNGRDLDAQAFWGKVADRRPLHDVLKSPNVGSGVDLSRMRGVPYVAYEYISGKSLGNLMVQAEREHSPIPTDLALFIADRIALGLAVGYENRFHEDRILHGFLMPNLVMLSNEGEIRVLGFEVAPGLRAGMAASAVAADVTPYLSPEALGGAPISKTDDIYSLGAILFELLTGRRPQGGGAAVAQVDGATLAADAMPIPPELVTLLKRSLGPAAQRVPDVVSWHKALAKIMVDRHYQPTTFNLAFFMHTLFRDEIDRESKEIEVEKTVTVAAKQVVPPAAVPSADRSGGATKPQAPVFSTYSSTSEAASSAPGNKKGLIIGIAAGGAVVVAGVLYLLLSGGGSKPQENLPQTDATITIPASASTAEHATSMTPDEIKAQLDKMLEERTAAMEKNLKTQYDSKISELQKALTDAQKTGATRVAVPATAAPPPTTTAEKPAPTGGASEPAPAATTPSQPAASTSEPAATSGTTASAPAEEPRPVEPAPAPVQAPATTSTTRAQSVRVGDLVEAGPGVTPPKLASRLEPRYPPTARNFNKSATVNVRALVDENGRVERAEVSGAKAGYGFDDAALAAARSARFDPATKGGVRVKMWTLLRITFQP